MTQTDPRPSWDEWALGIARAVAARADCTRSQVGAVILDRDHRIIATGYNGTPRPGEPGCLTAGACPRGRRGYDEQPPGGDYSDCHASHAEVNAILHVLDSGRAHLLPTATIYTTRTPCPGCQALIRAHGLTTLTPPADCTVCGFPASQHPIAGDPHPPQEPR